MAFEQEHTIYKIKYINIKESDEFNCSFYTQLRKCLIGVFFTIHNMIYFVYHNMHSKYYNVNLKVYFFFKFDYV